MLDPCVNLVFACFIRVFKEEAGYDKQYPSKDHNKSIISFIILFCVSNFVLQFRFKRLLESLLAICFFLKVVALLLGKKLNLWHPGIISIVVVLCAFIIGYSI